MNAVNTLNVTGEFDKLVVKYAVVPTTSMVQDYLVEIVKPIHWIPQKLSMSLTEIWNSKLNGHELIVRNLVLSAWQKALKANNPTGYNADAQEWLDKMLAITNVELIECDLLAPKKKE
jgi:hypothetical protein